MSLARPAPILAAALAIFGTATVPIPLAAQADEVAGAWILEWEGPRGTLEMAFDLTREDDAVGGTVTMALPRREAEMEVEGEVDGATVVLTFEMVRPGGGPPAGRGGGAGRRAPPAGGPGGAPTFRFEGTLIEGELRGTLETPRGDPVEAILRRPEG